MKQGSELDKINTDFNILDLNSPIIVWVAWMSRWGSPIPDHAYAVGIYDNPHIAKEQGKKESNFRGNKYEVQVATCYLNNNRLSKRYFQEKINYPNNVLLAWVTFDKITLLLGVFEEDKISLAQALQEKLYPNWKLNTEIKQIIKTTN